MSFQNILEAMANAPSYTYDRLSGKEPIMRSISSPPTKSSQFRKMQSLKAKNDGSTCMGRFEALPRIVPSPKPPFSHINRRRSGGEKDLQPSININYQNILL